MVSFQTNQVVQPNQDLPLNDLSPLTALSVPAGLIERQIRGNPLHHRRCQGIERCWLMGLPL